MPRCVITAQDDTTMSSYWNSTESEYVDFTTLDLSVGEKLYFNNVFFARISTIAASTITLSTNPGQYIYNEILRNGFINVDIKRTPDVYCYSIDKYCGAALIKKGESYNTYPESAPISSEVTKVTTNSIIALYFEKGNNIEDVKISVTPGYESGIINDINKYFRRGKDISFSSEKLKINKDILYIDSIVSSNNIKSY